MKNFKALAGASGLALLMAMSFGLPATRALAQATTPGTATTVSATQSADQMDEDLARQISEAWSQGKDASGAVAFQENGEIAMSEGNDAQAQRDFQAAEQELARVRPTYVGNSTSSTY
jgi:hypothetical protein